MTKLKNRFWTVVFISGEDTESHAFRLRAATVVAVGMAAVALLLSVGWGLGIAWERVTESERTRELAAEVERL